MNIFFDFTCRTGTNQARHRQTPEELRVPHQVALRVARQVELRVARQVALLP